MKGNTSMNELRNLNDLSLDELKEIAKDLQNGVRYNIIKSKFGLNSSAIDKGSLQICNKLISEREPKNPTIPNSTIKPQTAPHPSNLNVWYDATGEAHYGVQPDIRYSWTWTPCFRAAVENGTTDEWYRISANYSKQYSASTAVSDEVF